MNYIHFSSRPEEPRVPPRAMNALSGGSGPLGVYTYQADARMMTFGADRKYAFLLTPTVAVTYTNRYTHADLARDLERLRELADITRPLRLYEKWLDVTGRPGPAFHKLWYVISRLQGRGGDGPGVEGEGFGDPARGRELFVELGHRVIDDRYGIIYASEPEQAVFLTDDSFTARAVSPRDARDRAFAGQPNPGPGWEEYKRKQAALKRARQERVDALQALIDGRPIAAFTADDGNLLVIVHDDTHADGGRRASFLLPDGPRGHTTRRTELELVEELAGDLRPPFREVSEQEVMDWTNTPRYELGSRRVAYVQAINTLSWLASKVGRRDLFKEAEERAHAEVAGPRGSESVAAFDRAIDILAAAIRELPTPNPRRAFVRNPPWVTQALADHYELLLDKVPSRWLPQLAHVRAAPRDRMLADLVEYGCGAYGCVLATNDPRTVLKVTTDDTEAEFAAELAPSLPAAICVDYRLVVRLAAKHERRTIHLLWRESAQHVGEVAKHLGREALELVHQQHAAGQYAYDLMMRGYSPFEIEDAALAWVASVERMGKVPALRSLARGIVDVFERDKILFGDIHEGNLGMVERDGQEHWVITDPGHVAVLSFLFT